MKGNSERIKNKNLKDFCGKPLFYKILNTLLSSNFIDEVIINTDSEIIIKEIDENFNNKVKIHNRPIEIQGDYVSMNKIIDYDLKNSSADIYLQTHSTNPLLTTKSIDSAIKKMIEVQKGEKHELYFKI